jgi:hypothetical protein
MGIQKTVTVYLGEAALDVTGTFYQGTAGRNSEYSDDPAEADYFEVERVEVSGQDLTDYLSNEAMVSIEEMACEAAK